MVGAHQHLNGSRDLMVCHMWVALAAISLSTKFEVSSCTYRTDMTDDIK